MNFSINSRASDAFLGTNLSKNVSKYIENVAVDVLQVDGSGTRDKAAPTSAQTVGWGGSDMMLIKRKPSFTSMHIMRREREREVGPRPTNRNLERERGLTITLYKSSLPSKRIYTLISNISHLRYKGGYFGEWG